MMTATILKELAQMENVTANLAGNCKTALVNYFAASIYLVPNSQRFVTESLSKSV